jgi:UDP-N-acetylmuramoyl-L-alanyl-D-glutamate--2,6-diaminopimelate ligase
MGAHADVVVDLDRSSAIRNAVFGASTEDLVLITGKGHEKEQIVGQTRRRFCDVREAEEAHLARPIARS